MPCHSHQKLTLDAGLQPCAAEWGLCPAAAPLLAVGTYQLDEATQQRHGQLLMYRLAEQDPPAAAAGAKPPPGLHLEPLSSFALPGIFDLRWHPRSAMPRLAAALADGSVRELAFGSEPAAGGAAATPTAATLQPGADPAEGMAVSLDYSRADGCQGDQLAVSYSSGQLQVFQAAPAGMASLATWQAHSLEAWAAATDHWHAALLHSGGDDAAYRVWDTRQGFAAPAWQSSKAHGAGVCCVASSPHQQHAVCTGSYDDCLRLWDLRAPHRPVVQAEVDTGGGVWRARWHPSDPCLLLAACMYAGYAVLRVAAGTEAAEAAIKVLATYEHAPGALSYGAAWCCGGAAADSGGAARSLVATASFYDRQLHLWSYDP